MGFKPAKQRKKENREFRRQRFESLVAEEIAFVHREAVYPLYGTYGSIRKGVIPGIKESLSDRKSWQYKKSPGGP